MEFEQPRNLKVNNKNSRTRKSEDKISSQKNARTSINNESFQNINCEEIILTSKNFPQNNKVNVMIQSTLDHDYEDIPIFSKEKKYNFNKNITEKTKKENIIFKNLFTEKNQNFNLNKVDLNNQLSSDFKYINDNVNSNKIKSNKKYSDGFFHNKIKNSTINKIITKSNDSNYRKFEIKAKDKVNKLFSDLKAKEKKIENIIEPFLSKNNKTTKNIKIINYSNSKNILKLNIFSDLNRKNNKLNNTTNNFFNKPELKNTEYYSDKKESQFLLKNSNNITDVLREKGYCNKNNNIDDNNLNNLQIEINNNTNNYNLNNFQNEKINFNSKIYLDFLKIEKTPTPHKLYEEDNFSENLSYFNYKSKNFVRDSFTTSNDIFYKKKNEQQEKLKDFKSLTNKNFFNKKNSDFFSSNLDFLKLQNYMPNFNTKVCNLKIEKDEIKENKMYVVNEDLKEDKYINHIKFNYMINNFNNFKDYIQEPRNLIKTSTSSSRIIRNTLFDKFYNLNLTKEISKNKIKKN